MGTSSLQISLQSPKIRRINLTEQSAHSIGLAVPIPYGMATMQIGTMEYWAGHVCYVPKRGEIIVYSDRQEIDGVYYPGIKIGDGSAYVVDLPFVGDDIARGILAALEAHTSNSDVHVRTGERDFWSNKIDCNLSGETLILKKD